MRTLRKNFSANQRKAYKQEKAAAAGFIETVTNVVLSPTKAAESPSGAQSSQGQQESPNLKKSVSFSTSPPVIREFSLDSAPNGFALQVQKEEKFNLSFFVDASIYIVAPLLYGCFCRFKWANFCARPIVTSLVIIHWLARFFHGTFPGTGQKGYRFTNSRFKFTFRDKPQQVTSWFWIFIFPTIGYYMICVIFETLRKVCLIIGFNCFSCMKEKSSKTSSEALMQVGNRNSENVRA